MQILQNHSKTKSVLFILSAILFFNGCSKSSSNPKPTPQAPTLTVTSLGANSGSYNTSIVITGIEFSATAANDQVFFNGQVAVVTAATTTQLTAIVPLGAGTGNVTVSVNNGAVVSGPTFTYLPSLVSGIFAGNGMQGFADGTGTDASFRETSGIAVDANGNVFVADKRNNKIRKITPAGVVSTFAIATSPAGITLDAAGNVYFTEFDTGIIKKATPAGVVSIIAGSGSTGSANGVGAAASFNEPSGIAVDATGNLYVADQLNCLIRKITPAGLVTTFAGIGANNLTNTPPVNGLGATATFVFPTDIAIDASGNLYVADRDDSMIRKITPGGIVSTLAGSYNSGSADGLGAAAGFFMPSGVCVDATGNVYVADQNNGEIRKITPAGMVTTIAAQPAKGAFYNHAPLTALFNFPVDVAVDAAGNIYVTNNSITVSKISMQ
jgi:sugar lactone lactonase YvrE